MLEIVELIVSKSGVLKMKEYLPFCKEFIILCVEDFFIIDKFTSCAHNTILKR